MKVFVEFVLRLIFVDLKLSQNPYMPTTGDKQKLLFWVICVIFDTSHVRQDKKKGVTILPSLSGS